MEQPEPLKKLVKYDRLVPRNDKPNTSMIELDPHWNQKFVFTWRKFQYYNVSTVGEFYILLNQMNPTQRNFYESIKEGWQKLHFDIDMKSSNMSIPTLDYAELVKNYVIRAIVEYFKENVQEPLLIANDIMVFPTRGSVSNKETGTDEEKYSYHIVVDNFAFPSSAHCKEATKKILTKVPTEMLKYIDISVNKKNQQFRTWKSCKENEKTCRFKEFEGIWIYFGEKINWSPRILNDARWSNQNHYDYLIFERSLIGYFAVQPFIVNFDIPKLITRINGEGSEPPKIDIDAAKKLVPPGWKITKSYDDSFAIEPETPATPCILCKNLHEPDTQWIEISGDKQEVLFKCRKVSDQSHILGTLNPGYIESTEVTTEAVKALVPVGWYITSVHGTNFSLKPMSRTDTECPLCKRVHEHENQWITVCGAQQRVFFKCRRADTEGGSKRSLYLGMLKPNAVVSEEDRLRSIEYQYNKPQIETNDYYCAKYARPLNPTKGVIDLLCSFMGTGKTTEFNNYIRRTNAHRVGVLSPRILYTESITSEYNQPQTEENKHYLLPFIGKKFQTYLEVNENGARDYRNHDRLVIQMESLHHLLNVQPFDVLILDELESLLTQYGSGTMKEQILCCRAFEKLIRETPIIIGGDAFLSEKSRQTLMKINPNIHIVRNDYKPARRIAYLYPTYESLFYRAYQSLAMGKKIVFVCASRKKALEFASGCAVRGIVYKLYVGKSNNTEQERQELRNVNQSWSGPVRCVIYNSRITVGVNYNKEDEFDQLFVYGSSHSCCVRDTFQGTLRVRHIKDNEMHANIYQKAVSNRLPLKEADVKKYIEDLVIPKEELLKNVQPSMLTIVEEEPENLLMKHQPSNVLDHSKIDQMAKSGSVVYSMCVMGRTMTSDTIRINDDPVDQYLASELLKIQGEEEKKRQPRKTKEYMAKSVWNYAPEWLKICLIYNIMEANLSKVCYRAEFEKYLVRCNYKLMEHKPKDDEVDEGGVGDNDKLKYAEIPDVEKEMVEDLRWKLRAGIANGIDRKMLDKYEYNEMVKENLAQDLREALFNKFFAGDRYNQYHFRNRYDEKYETPESLAHKYVDRKYIESAPIRGNRLMLIRNLNGILGIQNSGEGFNVPEERFVTAQPLLNNYIPEMQRLFNVNSQDKNHTAKLVKLIDKVYRDWSGTGIVRESQRVRITGTGRKQRIYTITKEHDQSVEESIRPRPLEQIPVQNSSQVPVITVDLITQAQESVNIDLTRIEQLMNSGTVVHMS